LGNITLSNRTQKNLNICLDEIAQELSYFLVPFADGASSCSWSAVSKQEIAVKPKQMKHYLFQNLKVVNQETRLGNETEPKCSGLEPSDYILHTSNMTPRRRKVFIMTRANKIKC
jgi:hypothetical protein